MGGAMVGCLSGGGKMGALPVIVGQGLENWAQKPYPDVVRIESSPRVRLVGEN